MYKILTKTIIIALWTCYPAHGEKITGLDAMKIWHEGKVQAREGVSKALILYNKSLHLCYLYMGNDQSLVSDCYNSNKEMITKTD